MRLIPLTIVFTYIALLYVATWLTRHWSRGGMIAYLLAGRQLPAGVVATMLAGLAVGGASTVGTAEQAYQAGLSAGWYNAAWAAGALLMGLVAARRYRRLEICTLPQLFERHYGTFAQVLASIGQIFIQIVITSLQYVAGGAILSSLMGDVFTFERGMLLTACLFVGITLIGGFWAAGLTNVINVIVIYVGILLGCILALRQVGGLSSLAERLPQGHPGFDLGAIGAGLIAGWFMVMCTQVFSTQAVVQIGFAAKDESAARGGYLLGALVILPVGFLCAIIGMAGAALHTGLNPTEALPRTLLGLDPAVAGLILAGLWAADVSTASALLMGSATLVVSDVVRRFLAPGMDEKAQRSACRISILALAVATYLLAVHVRGILNALLVGLSLSTAYTLVSLTTLYAPGWCRRSTASATLLTTMAALGLWVAVPQIKAAIHLPHPIYFTWMASLAGFALSLALDRRRIVPPAR